MKKVKIVNVVVTASVNQGLDFRQLKKHKEILYGANNYGGRVAYFKTANMQGKVCLFKSGKMISIGAKSEKQAAQELDEALFFLSEKGYIKKVKLNYETQNLVVIADFEIDLSLEKLSEDMRVIYEPEQFPGAIMRFDKPFKTSILVFASGKTVITGLKSQKQIESTVNNLWQTIRENQLSP